MISRIAGAPDNSTGQKTFNSHISAMVADPVASVVYNRSVAKNSNSEAENATIINSHANFAAGLSAQDHLANIRDLGGKMKLTTAINYPVAVESTVPQFWGIDVNTMAELNSSSASGGQIPKLKAGVPYTDEVKNYFLQNAGQLDSQFYSVIYASTPDSSDLLLAKTAKILAYVKQVDVELAVDVYKGLNVGTNMSFRGIILLDLLLNLGLDSNTMLGSLLQFCAIGFGVGGNIEILSGGDGQNKKLSSTMLLSKIALLNHMANAPKEQSFDIPAGVTHHKLRTFVNMASTNTAMKDVHEAHETAKTAEIVRVNTMIDTQKARIENFKVDHDKFLAEVRVVYEFIHEFLVNNKFIDDPKMAFFTEKWVIEQYEKGIVHAREADFKSEQIMTYLSRTKMPFTEAIDNSVAGYEEVKASKNLIKDYLLKGSSAIVANQAANLGKTELKPENSQASGFDNQNVDIMDYMKHVVNFRKEDCGHEAGIAKAANRADSPYLETLHTELLGFNPATDISPKLLNVSASILVLTKFNDALERINGCETPEEAQAVADEWNKWCLPASLPTGATPSPQSCAGALNTSCYANVSYNSEIEDVMTSNQEWEYESVKQGKICEITDLVLLSEERSHLKEDFMGKFVAGNPDPSKVEVLQLYRRVKRQATVKALVPVCTQISSCLSFVYPDKNVETSKRWTQIPSVMPLLIALALVAHEIIETYMMKQNHKQLEAPKLRHACMAKIENMHKSSLRWAIDKNEHFRRDVIFSLDRGLHLRASSGIVFQKTSSSKSTGYDIRAKFAQGKYHQAVKVLEGPAGSADRSGLIGWGIERSLKDIWRPEVKSVEPSIMKELLEVKEPATGVTELGEAEMDDAAKFFRRFKAMNKAMASDGANI